MNSGEPGEVFWITGGNRGDEGALGPLGGCACGGGNERGGVFGYAAVEEKEECADGG